MTRCRCAVFGCPSASYKKKCKDLNFHFFPNKPKQRKIWVNACKNKKISQMSKQSLVICSLHFKESDYTTVTMNKKNGTSNVKVLRNSIPTLNLPGAKSINKKIPTQNDKTKKINKENTTYKEKLRSKKSHAENKSSLEENTTVKKKEESMSLSNIIHQLLKVNYTADSDELLCEEFSSDGSLSKPEPKTTVFNDDDLISAKDFGFDDSEEEDVIKMEPDWEIDYEPEVPEGTQLNTIETVDIHDSVSQSPNKKMKTEPNPGDNSTVTYERGNEQDNEDDCSTFAAHLRARMRLLDPQQKCIARKHLSDIMFMVETKQLQLTTEIVYRQPRS